MPSWRMLDMQALMRALSRAWAKTGKRRAAMMAMIAITTSSSISVNAGFRAWHIVGFSSHSSRVGVLQGESDRLFERHRPTRRPRRRERFLTQGGADSGHVLV